MVNKSKREMPILTVHLGNPLEIVASILVPKQVWYLYLWKINLTEFAIGEILSFLEETGEIINVLSPWNLQK